MVFFVEIARKILLYNIDTHKVKHTITSLTSKQIESKFSK